MQHDQDWLNENVKLAGSDGKANMLNFAETYHEHMARLRPASEYDESMGDVLWVAQMSGIAKYLVCDLEKISPNQQFYDFQQVFTNEN